MKIFVTEGGGFVGRVIIKKLIQEGHHVAGLVYDEPAADVLQALGAGAVIGDLLDPGLWAEEVRDSDVIISLSQPFYYGERMFGDQARRRSYLHGQMVGNIFLAAQGSEKVRAIVVTYGVNGFGNRGRDIVTETTDLEPQGYERTICGAYYHIDKTSRKTRVPLVNVFAGLVYGGGGWFEQIVEEIKTGSPMIVGNGENYLSLVHVDNLVAAYAKIVEYLPIGEKYCVVDDGPVTQRELFEFMARHLNRRMPGNVSAESYARRFGALAAEARICSTRVSNAKLKRCLLPQLAFADYALTMPAMLSERMHKEDLCKAS